MIELSDVYMKTEQIFARRFLNMKLDCAESDFFIL